MADKFDRLDKYNRVLARSIKGESFTKAAKSEHTTARTIKRIDRESGFNSIAKTGNRLSFNIEFGRAVVLITNDGKTIFPVELDNKNYMRYVFFIAEIQNGIEYKRFTIYDINGNKYKLSVDFDTYAALIGNAENWNDLFYPERWT